MQGPSQFCEACVTYDKALISLRKIRKQKAADRAIRGFFPIFRSFSVRRQSTVERLSLIVRRCPAIADGMFGSGAQLTILQPHLPPVKPFSSGKPQNRELSKGMLCGWRVSPWLFTAWAFWRWGRLPMPISSLMEG
jgi:uncharacterized membrane protein YccC